MSNFNMKFIKEAIQMYGLQNAQTVANKQGNTCLQVLVNGEVYKTGTLNKQACYDLIKKLADKQQNPDKYIEENQAKNQVSWTQDNNTVYINGRKHTIFDVIKEVKPSRLYSEYLYNKKLSPQQMEIAYKIKTWLANEENHALYLLHHLRDLDYGMNDVEIVERKEQVKEWIKTGV